MLVEQAQRNSTNKNGDNRKRMANALFEAFRAFASASLAKEVIYSNTHMSNTHTIRRLLKIKFSLVWNCWCQRMGGFRWSHHSRQWCSQWYRIWRTTSALSKGVLSQQKVVLVILEAQTTRAKMLRPPTLVIIVMSVIWTLATQISHSLLPLPHPHLLSTTPPKRTCLRNWMLLLQWPHPSLLLSK